MFRGALKLLSEGSFSQRSRSFEQRIDRAETGARLSHDDPAWAKPEEIEGTRMKLPAAPEGATLSTQDPTGEAALIALAHASILKGAAAGFDPGTTFRTIEIKTSFFASPEGKIPTVEAALLHAQGAVIVWRAKIFAGAGGSGRGEGACLAEVTETLVATEKSEGQAAILPLRPDEEEGDKSRRGGDVIAMPEGARRRGGVAQERLEQILRGAYEVISRKGYANASIREIAAAAGMPIPTMYLYIKTKEDLLYFMSNEYLSRLTKHFEETLNTSSSATETLASVIAEYVEYCGKNRKLINLVYREGKSLSRENREKIFTMDRSFVGIWEKIIEHGKATGEFKVDDAALAANYMYFLCTAWAIRHWNLATYGEAKIRESLTTFILRAVGART
jgi:AcrR family transcriptional regulator